MRTLTPVPTSDESEPLPALEDPLVLAALEPIESRDLRGGARAAIESLCWDVVPIADVTRLDLLQFLCGSCRPAGSSRTMSGASR